MAVDSQITRNYRLNAAAEVTGQDRVVRDMRTVLARSRRRPTVLRLKGPSGAGKTWTAQALADQWEAAGGVALFARGEEMFTRRSYFPFHVAVRGESAREKVSALKSIASEGATGVPVAGNTLRELVRQLVSRNETVKARQTPHVTDAEREILLRIESLAGKHRILVICDNFQWWDKPSLELLALGLDEATHEVFPSWKNIAILAIETTGYRCSEPAAVDAFFRAAPPHSFDLGYCRESEFGDLLRAFGAAVALDAELLNRLHSICGGHLEIARRLANSELISRQDCSDDVNPALSRVLWDLLEQRLGKAATTDQTISILEAAAVIGDSFSDAELSCLSSLPVERLHEALRPAEALGLLRGSDFRRCSFAHDLVRTYFYDRPGKPQVELNHKFAECLRVLSPGEYGRRSAHHLRAGDRDTAGELLVLSFLSDSRRGRKPSLESLKATLEPRVFQLLGVFDAALRLFDAGSYGEAIQCLERVESTFSDALLAERDVMKARCKIKLLDGQSRRDAVRLLQRWNGLQASEPEVWARVALYLVVAHLYVGDVTEARDVEEHLVRMLRDRARFDPSACVAINHCRLKANMLHTAAVARERLNEAVKYFGRQEAGTMVDPVHCYIGLINLSANFMADGEFGLAFERIQKAREIIGCFHSLAFPRTDILGNNFAIAGFLAGRFSLAQIQRGLATICSKIPPTNDSPLLHSNLAAICAASGKYEEAASMLDSEFTALVQKDAVDGYYPYFVGNNLSGCLFMLGRLEESRNVWTRISPYVSEFVGPIGPYMAKRHALMSTLLSDADRDQNWQTYLTDKFDLQVGPGWRFYGRGFLLSELEFWSDE